jgi:hypothetical protein
VTPAGTLPVGAACLTGTQCETAYCKFTFIDDDGGSSYESSCGTCADTIGAGESCASGDTPCAPGTACSGAPNPTCVAVTYGGAGDACDDTALVCNEGLFCQTTTMTCSAPGAAGARCTGSPDCATGLVCAAGACAVGATAGETCTSTVVCAQGLTCELPTGTCVAITWASAGAPCSNAAQCLVGGCNQGTTFETNTCPTVVADGEPCPIDGASTCDTFSQCVNGVCALPTAATCN